MEMITESSWNTLINLDLKTPSIDKYNWAQKISKEKQTIFLLDKASKENWDDYRKDLTNFLKKRKIILSLNLLSWEELDNTMDNLNKMWDSFEEGILFAAKRNFPTKRILSLSEKGKMNPKVHRTDLHQNTISLSQISREIKKCINTTQRIEWPKIFERTNMHLREINNRHEIAIQLINSTDQNEKEASNLKEIENFIKLCYKRIQNKQGKMLNSLLDRPYNKIDRVLDQKEKNLLIHATEMKDKTRAFFQSQYKKKNTSLEDLLNK
ncbi:43687_t:CDS:2 [Gigaspora margarita]|uniref:43687_t:CDS:1 n=1 Tax=Gigaspora margarita TaxID=4874 RepID=A0ABN7VU59_GIGMA|nr:43687_t:CDS:2 [Gigaspora margarita]